MKIVADKHIAYIEDYFGGAGELVLKPGRAIAAEFAWAAAPVDSAGWPVAASRRRLGVANARGDGVDATMGAIEVDWAAGGTASLK